MKNNFTLGIIVFLIGIMTSCKSENQDFKLYSCEFDQFQYNDSLNYSKWIDNKEDALKTKLNFGSALDKRNLDSLYKETAQFLFIVGGGGIYVDIGDCTPKIKNDTLLIKYKVDFTTGAVGEAAATFACLEINKQKYPNYKNMKVIYVNQDL